MVTLSRFVSIVEANESSHSPSLSVSVSLFAELKDGRLILVLDDRGWNSNQRWAEATSAEIEQTARDVVGPDEPYGEQTMEEAIAAHWEYLRKILAAQGVDTDSGVLKTAPHDVVLSESVVTRLNLD
ncbi:hypothetical protein CVS30_10170 [Arthrobacter psychrolactophilus]|uniref:Uncharacterized protein n=1 Tax=Arthrobacter psychrolactophilus TaxID=92442 RepID=A0A2V5J6X7_9MICC|nr:hypothetical protein [Arthrobacter psychrolactophilus]PYI38480.1 hypothetical protein CVS30_10170 [Arthrobacter psychrolactophilus]